MSIDTMDNSTNKQETNEEKHEEQIEVKPVLTRKEKSRIASYKYYKKNQELCNQRKREAWKNNPELRARRLADMKIRYRKKKQERLQSLSQ